MTLIHRICPKDLPREKAAGIMRRSGFESDRTREALPAISPDAYMPQRKRGNACRKNFCFVKAIGSRRFIT